MCALFCFVIVRAISQVRYYIPNIIVTVLAVMFSVFVESAHMPLTHWPLTDVEVIWKVYIFKLILIIDILSISWEIGLRWVPQTPLFQVMVWCRQLIIIIDIIIVVFSIFIIIIFYYHRYYYYLIKISDVYIIFKFLWPFSVENNHAALFHSWSSF